MKITHSIFATMVASLALASCATNPQRVDFPSNSDPQATVNALKDRMRDDQAKQYDNLSPRNFAQARDYLEKAQEGIGESRPAEETLKNAGEAAARLQVVEANGAKHTQVLTPVLNARKAALDASAQQVVPAQLAKADEDLREFGEDIEKARFNPDSKELSALEAKYSNVEVAAVKKAALGEAYTILEKSKDRGAKKKAPITYNAAQTRYDTALRSIEANRRSPEAYQKAVSEAMIGAHKLEFVLDTMGTNHTSELAAVKIYDQHQEITATQKQVSREREIVSELQGENDSFANKEAMNRKIAQIRSEFSESEADVLRDGDKIILRLKTMQFPTGRAELPKSSLDTLQKVKEMITAVPFEKIIVEGHTDTVGGAKKNKVLSQNRADTVKQYLVAENAVPESKIEAKGLGYEKPLTSNKTKQGRAVNRRVDVIIDGTASM